MPASMYGRLSRLSNKTKATKGKYCPQIASQSDWRGVCGCSAVSSRWRVREVSHIRGTTTNNHLLRVQRTKERPTPYSHEQFLRFPCDIPDAAAGAGAGKAATLIADSDRFSCAADALNLAGLGPRENRQAGKRSCHSISRSSRIPQCGQLYRSIEGCHQR